MDQYAVEAIPSASPDSLVGHIVDTRFELFEYVGSGGLTHVFRAWDQRLQHVVAIKILRQDLAINGSAVAAFEQEARRAANLPAHPNIVPIHEVGRSGNIPYVVAEFVAGDNLQRIIANQAPLDVDRAFRICRQAAQALAFAHGYSLVHRDIRPSNIMISLRGEVKVTDFGFTEAEPLDPSRTRILTDASPYLSPAEAQGQHPGVDSDIYSLGIVLWEMLTGAPPFHAGNPVVLATMQVRQQLPDIRQINPSVSPAAAAVVMRAVSWSSEERFGSATAFALALQQHATHDKGDANGTTFIKNGTTEPAILSNETTKPSNPAASHHAVSPKPPARAAFVGRAPSRWRPSWGSLIFLMTIGIAAAGGWFAYKAIWHALNGPGPTTARAHATRHGLSAVAAHPGRHTNRHTSAPQHRTRGAAFNPNLVGSPGCANQAFQTLHLPAIWAEETHVLPNHGIRFDYTVGNDGSQCQNVRLGLALYSSAHPGIPLTDAGHDRVVLAMPGTHVYHRRFHIPAAAAGQRFDALLTIADRSNAHVYAEVRVANLVTVAPR
ncbi:MAG: hypothetical protein NVS2B16_10730 [Chloroflexota bacterium]